MSEIDPEMLLILQKMLQFNPYFRHCANECLSNPYFEKIKSQKNDVHAVIKISLDVDQDDAFDYSGVKANKY